MSLNKSAPLLAVTVKYARKLRKHPTKSEEILWQELRQKKLNGWRFQRQRPILIELRGVGTFAVADFYCAGAKLVVEVDGSVHEAQKDADQARDEALSKRGFDVLRVSVFDVEHHLGQVLARIDDEVRRKVLERKHATRPPSLILREGGKGG